MGILQTANFADGNFADDILGGPKYGRISNVSVFMRSL
jgi:hypothetical protein